MKKKTYEAPPPGQYTVVFKGIELGSHPDFGDNQSWLFEVVAPEEYANSKVSKISSREIGGPKSNAYKLTKWLTGSTDEFDPDDYVGEEYQALLTTKDNGYNDIVNLWKPKGKPKEKSKSNKVFVTANGDKGFEGFEGLKVDNVLQN